MDLAVADLGDRGAGDLGGGELAVGGLGDGGGGGDARVLLDLAVADLADDSVGAGGDGGGGGGLDGAGAGGAGGAEGLEVDGVALSGGVLVVEVVEGAAQALVEDSRVAEGEGAVLTDGPAGSVDGTSLGRTVELELVVGGDVASAALGVGEDTILELDLEGNRLPLW